MLFPAIPHTHRASGFLFFRQKGIPYGGPREKHRRNFGLKGIRFSAIVFSGVVRTVLGELIEENTMKNFDSKSAVIGLLLGVCVMLVVGAGGNGSSEAGRYRVCPAGDTSSTCYVIDTSTGHVWWRYASNRGSDYGCPAEWDEQARKQAMEKQTLIQRRVSPKD